MPGKKHSKWAAKSKITSRAKCSKTIPSATKEVVMKALNPDSLNKGKFLARTLSIKSISV